MEERGTMRRALCAFALLAATLPAGCGRSDASTAVWEARVDTVGDTIVVHTVAGSVYGGPVELVERVRIGRLEGADHEILGLVAGLAEDGEGKIYLYDRQVPALRKYAADGSYMGTLGRKGGGPGEYASSDGGLAALPDGRVVLRDPGNARYTVYKPDGSYDSEWLGRGGFQTSAPLAVDDAGHAYAIVIREPGPGEQPWPTQLWITNLVRMSPNGTPLDTFAIPRYRIERKEIVAAREGSRSVSNVPFTGQFGWAMHPSGGILTTIGDAYAIDLHSADGTVVRMSRNAEPVPVLPEEKADAQERATRNMRNTVPDWRWNGPPIPDTKAPVTGLYAGRDGRIWVQVAAVAERIPDEERTPSPDPNRPPPPRFRTPVVFDVFEPDGRYVGRVHAPRGFATFPHPVFQREHIWAVWRDELDVSYVVKFAIVGPTS